MTSNEAARLRGGSSVDQSIARYRDAWAGDADDTTAFDALEEHYFLSGSWEDLKDLYRRRLEAPSLANQRQLRSQLMLRLAQVIEDPSLHRQANYFIQVTRPR